MSRTLLRTTSIVIPVVFTLAGACSDDDPTSTPESTVVLTNRSVTPEHDEGDEWAGVAAGGGR